MAHELILTLDFERPPSAEDLGEVFSALARDYREMTNGRTLVAIRVESGSITAVLTDAALAAVPYVVAGAAVITAINALAKFVENLKKWFGYVTSDNEKKRLYRRGKKSPGQLSVEAIIKIAANTGSRVRVKYKSEKGETLEAQLTPAEVIGARAQVSTEEVKKVGREPMHRNLRSTPEVQGAIDRLQQIDVQNLLPTEVRAIVDVIVAVLQAVGADYHLPGIVSELETRGLDSIAYYVRQHIRPSSGTHEPPLTTT